MDHHCVLCIHITIFYRGVIFCYINIINFNNHNLKKFIRAIIPIDLLQIYLLFFTQTRMSETVKKEQVLCHEKKQWLGFITHCLPSTQNIYRYFWWYFFPLLFSSYCLIQSVNLCPDLQPKPTTLFLNMYAHLLNYAEI